LPDTIQKLLFFFQFNLHLFSNNIAHYILKQQPKTMVLGFVVVFPITAVSG